MTEDHDALRALVAERDLTRLTPEERRVVEEHLAGCASCATLADDVRLIRQQIRDGGEAMFEPHPEPSALRDYAREHGEPDFRVGRHLRLCAPCRLEVETWRSRKAAAESGPAHPSTTGKRVASNAWIRLGVATATAALLGAVAGWRFHSTVSSSTAAPPPIVGSGTPTASGSIATGTTEAPVLHLLPGVLRGGEPAKQRWLLDRGETSIGIAVPLVMPASAGDTDRFRFEMLRAGAESVWSEENTLARIREHLEAAEVVNLIIVPPQPLAEGDYEFRVVPSAPASGAPPIYRARITIAYRQSPAATKAPQ